jgi:hypothetical protein
MDAKSKLRIRNNCEKNGRERKSVKKKKSRFEKLNLYISSFSSKATEIKKM